MGTLPWPHHRTDASTGLPLVFLHGFLGSCRDWDEIVPAFSDQHPCLCFDLPGHGTHRQRPLGAPLTLAELADELDASLGALGLERVALVGYSLGGRLALHAALRHPKRIGALVLEGASPGIADPRERAQRLALDQARASALRAEGMAAFVEAWYAAPLFSSLQGDAARLAAMKAVRAQNDPVWMAKLVAELSPGLQPSLWGELRHIRAPARVLAGSLDSAYVEVARKLAHLLPDACAAFVPDAGHNTHLEQPEAFAKIVREFLDAH